MKYFFHAETARYTERLKHMMILTVLSIFAVCIFCTVNIVLNFGSDIVYLLLGVIGGLVLLGMIFAFSAVYITEKYKKRHSKYTYFDFLPKGMVFSEYAGEYVHFGARVIMRRLYYIPFDKLESVSRDPKTAPHNLTFKGEIRCYCQESDRLGYHISEDGNLEFDSSELNERLFEEMPVLVIRERFGNTKKLEKSVNYYLEQFKNTPEKKPFNISDYVSVQKRRKLHTSNPALEEPSVSFSRNWK
ncbi:MAG: hypothetical protein J6C38_07645 [Oscillospiraceae bacterium]|nr:hypothetical protein [Oscillospiraceae bacterium]